MLEMTALQCLGSGTSVSPPTVIGIDDKERTCSTHLAIALNSSFSPSSSSPSSAVQQAAHSSFRFPSLSAIPRISINFAGEETCGGSSARSSFSSELDSSGVGASHKEYVTTRDIASSVFRHRGTLTDISLYL